MLDMTPGWQVRCVRCGTTRAAAAVGIVRIGARSWHARTLGWCSTCRRPAILAIERRPGPGKPDRMDDESGHSAAAGKPGAIDRRAAGWRLARAFGAVAACLYLPFAWWVLVGSALDRFTRQARLEYWLVTPGFFPGLYLFHPNEPLEWWSWAAVTLGLLVGLTWLGAAGPRRFWVAAGLALLWAIPSSLLGCVLFVLN